MSSLVADYGSSSESNSSFDELDESKQKERYFSNCLTSSSEISSFSRQLCIGVVQSYLFIIIVTVVINRLIVLINYKIILKCIHKNIL